MKKIDAGQAITILANLGVIGGIMFLAYEMRQNTNAIQAYTLQGLMDLSTVYLHDSSTDPEFVRLLERSMTTEPDDVANIELRQMQRIIRGQLFRYQSAFLHWRRGSLGDQDWEAYEKTMCDSEGVFGASFQQRFWPEERTRLPEEFVDFLEGCNPVFETPD